MAVVNTKSASVTAHDAGTSVNSAESNGVLRTDVGVVAVANGDSITSTLRVCRVPSNARVSALSLFCTAITSAAGDVGLYQTAANGGAVVDADFFIAAQSIATASAGINVIGGNVLSPANRAKRLWEALALPTDPGRDYDVTVTLTAAATAAGSVGVDIAFTI